MTSEIGYDNKPCNWYKQQKETPAPVLEGNEWEETLDVLTPDGDKQVFKNHLLRGGVETDRPYEIVVQRMSDDSFYREVYRRRINDLDTSDASLSEVRDAEYRVELMQGNGSASGHRHGVLEFEDLPQSVKDMFKTHDNLEWGEF